MVDAQKCFLRQNVFKFFQCPADQEAAFVFQVNMGIVDAGLEVDDFINPDKGKTLPCRYGYAP